MVHGSIFQMKGKDLAFELFIRLMGVLVFIITLYPLWFVLIASISDAGMVANGKVWFWPVGINAKGYAAVFNDSRIFIGYQNSLIVTIVGTILSLVVTIPCAYALSRRDFKLRRPLMLFFIFTMYFNGGLIPTYLTITKTLHMDNTLWVMIVPFCLNVYNLIVCRSFFDTSIPQELLESAKLEGCSNTRFFFSIVLPLSKAIVSVIMLYYVVARWNDYFTCLIYIRDNKLKTLQIILRDILLMNEAQQGSNSYTTDAALELTQLIKYSSIVVGMIPVMILYPLIQKYFEKGVMIGAIKG